MPPIIQLKMILFVNLLIVNLLIDLLRYKIDIPIISLRSNYPIENYQIENGLKFSHIIIILKLILQYCQSSSYTIIY